MGVRCMSQPMAPLAAPSSHWSSVAFSQARDIVLREQEASQGGGNCMDVPKKTMLILDLFDLSTDLEGFQSLFLLTCPIGCNVSD